MSNFHKVGGPVDWEGVRSLLYLNVLNLLELLGSCQLSHVGPGEQCIAMVLCFQGQLRNKGCSKKQEKWNVELEL